MMDDIENCDPKNIYLNMTTGELECLPGVNVAPQGYSQILPEVTVRQKNWWVKYVVIAIATYYLVKK
jgi:hypothetical protein